jgi:hypothetical protein
LHGISQPSITYWWKLRSFEQTKQWARIKN